MNLSLRRAVLASVVVGGGLLGAGPAGAQTPTPLVTLTVTPNPTNPGVTTIAAASFLPPPGVTGPLTVSIFLTGTDGNGTLLAGPATNNLSGCAIDTSTNRFYRCTWDPASGPASLQASIVVGSGVSQPTSWGVEAQARSGQTSAAFTSVDLQVFPAPTPTVPGATTSVASSTTVPSTAATTVPGTAGPTTSGSIGQLPETGGDGEPVVLGLAVLAFGAGLVVMTRRARHT